MGIFRKNTFVILFVSLCCFPFGSSAQLTKVMGKVTDAETKEGIPFVNVAFKGTTVGTTTDFDGKYSIDTKYASDSLVASYMGYTTVAKKVVKNKFQEINIELSPNRFNLTEVVITPGENPAEILLRKIIENKDKNSREKLEAYQYEVYNKIQFDINNVTDKFKNRAMFKSFKFIFDNVDTSTVNGKAYLPVFLTESLSDIYFRKTPKTQKEIIKASKVSGVKNESISQFLGDMYQNVYVYDNYINLFDKNFISPVANFGLGFYKYYLIDSMYIDNQWCYQVMFKPRRKQELTFTGNFWVHDTTFAVRKVEMRIADDANINFINDIVIGQEYKLINKQYWMLTRDNMIVDLNIIENNKTTTGFYAHKTTSYKDFIFEELKDKQLYSSAVNIEVKDDSFDKSEEFWETARHEELSKDEKNVYTMVDSIKKIPIFKTYVDIIFMFTTGHYVWGNFELGPYYKTYSFNSVEGNRFRFGGRTSNDFSKKIMIDAYVAYGLKDEQFKYGGGFLYMLSKNPRKSFGASYKWDMEQLGQSQNAFSEDNIVASVFRRNPLTKLSMVEEYKGFYEHEWFTGFSNKINLMHRDVFPAGSSVFEFNSGGRTQDKNSITTSEVRFDCRFAYREKFLMGEFERVSLGAKYPVLETQYTYGIKDFWESDYEYHKLQVFLKHWFNIRSFGWSKYIIEGGQIWGRLPYPLLKLHEGNETLSFDEYAFNMMNYYEFVSDRYLSAYYTHHFDGYFLNHIPLMRKLKWREVGYVKGVIGSLNEDNKLYSTFPETLTDLSKPYFEAGVGIENIFKVIRIDALWRLSYLDHPDIARFGIMGTLQASF